MRNEGHPTSSVLRRETSVFEHMGVGPHAHYVWKF